jgi:transcriptional regulator with XRE-family HTH domain
MFLETLSFVVLQLCDAYGWSYEAAAEHCNLSSRYIGDIVRGRTAPTIRTLEKLCIGFSVLPNELLVTEAALNELSFRIPQLVTQYSGRIETYGYTTYPICPRCKITMNREYQAYCDRCGQRLWWKNYAKASAVKLAVTNT